MVMLNKTEAVKRVISRQYLKYAGEYRRASRLSYCSKLQSSHLNKANQSLLVETDIPAKISILMSRLFWM